MQRMKSEYILKSKIAVSYLSQPLHAEGSLALKDKEWSDSDSVFSLSLPTWL